MLRAIVATAALMDSHAKCVRLPLGIMHHRPQTHTTMALVDSSAFVTAALPDRVRKFNHSGSALSRYMNCSAVLGLPKPPNQRS